MIYIESANSGANIKQKCDNTKYYIKILLLFIKIAFPLLIYDFFIGDTFLLSPRPVFLLTIIDDGALELVKPFKFIMEN